MMMMMLRTQWKMWQQRPRAPSSAASGLQPGNHANKSKRPQSEGQCSRAAACAMLLWLILAAESYMLMQLAIGLHSWHHNSAGGNACRLCSRCLNVLLKSGPSLASRQICPGSDAQDLWNANSICAQGS